MQKKELRKLRALNATDQMMEKGRRYTEKEVGYGYAKRKKKVPEYDLLLRVQNCGKIIKVAVFLPEKMREGIRTPRYEIFVNPEGNEWVNRTLDDKGRELGWGNAMLLNMAGVMPADYDYAGKKIKIYLNGDGRKTLNGLKTNSKEKGALRLQAWQREQRDAAIKQKEKREQEPWDADMNLVPELPKGFEEWMRKDVCQDVYIFYKYRRGGAKEGYCSRCKKLVPVKNPKHNMDTKCPSCRAKAVFKADGKIGTLATKTYIGEIIQAVSGGIVIRRFEQYQIFEGRPLDNPWVRTYETIRTLLFDNGTTRYYGYEKYKNKYIRWIPRENSGYGWNIALYIALYKRNTRQLKNSGTFKRSALFLWKKLPMSVEEYIRTERGNPVVEMLAKTGMFRLAEELIEKDFDEELLAQEKTELAKILKIDRARLKRLKEMDGGVAALQWMQVEKRKDIVWDDLMIMELERNGIEPGDFEFFDADTEKSYNYVLKQAGIACTTLYNMAVTYRDYLDMAQKMKMNTALEQIAKPKDLKAAHDRLVMMEKEKGMEKQAGAIEKKFPKVNGQLPKLQKFEFTSGDYCIVAPKKVLDIVREGVILSHCVHTCDYYFSRIQTDESYLFFLRRSRCPDIPWYTLEVEPSGNIRQKRTTGDNQNPDFQQAVDFLKKWQRHFKKQLTKEERKLGEKADRLRKENYAKLRKDGNRVWHGKLAGQLLADVLEADFMEAIG